MKKYIPVLILTAVIAASAPFMRPVKADQGSLADRLNAINAARVPASQTDHWVVVLVGTSDDYQGQLYPSGLIVNVASCSSGAPQIHHGDNLAASLAALKESGATITVNSWGWLNYTAIK